MVNLWHADLTLVIPFRIGGLVDFHWNIKFAALVVFRSTCLSQISLSAFLCMILYLLINSTWTMCNTARFTSSWSHSLSGSSPMRRTFFLCRQIKKSQWSVTISGKAWTTKDRQNASNPCQGQAKRLNGLPDYHQAGLIGLTCSWPVARMHGIHSLKPHNATHWSQQVPLISFVHARCWNLDTPEVFYELPDPLLDSARHSDVKYHNLTIKVLPCSASFFLA